MVLYCSARYGGDSCNASEPETCPEGMFCSAAGAGLCECRVGRMTSDRLFCLRYHQKLVGSSCTPHMDTCYQRAGECQSGTESVLSHRRHPHRPSARLTYQRRLISVVSADFFLPRDAYAIHMHSAKYAMIRCLSVTNRYCVITAEWNEAVFFAQRLSSAYPTLCCKEIRIPPE